MKDCIGQEIQIDDSVIINDKHYSSLRQAKVVGFTPQKIKVCGEGLGYQRTFSELLCTPDQILVINVIKEHKPELFV